MTYEAPWYIRVWAWLKAHWWLPFAVLVVAAGVAVFLSTRGKSGSELLRIDRRLKDSKKKADEEIAQLEEQTEAQIVEVERKHVQQLEQLAQDQRDEYERVRKDGPRAVARWLNAFDRGLR